MSASTRVMALGSSWAASSGASSVRNCGFSGRGP